MQAIILAAGMGKRLKDLTAHQTKCMVMVNGVTLIERALTHLDSLGLQKIVLVVGYEAASLVSFVKTLGISTALEFVENPIYDTTNNIYSLFLAREYLLQDDTLLLESDIIFDQAVLRALTDDPYPTLALVARYESWMDGGVLTVDDDSYITDFLSKQQVDFNNKGRYYKTVNIYKFSREFSQSFYVPFLEAYCTALGNNEYYEQVLKVIALVMNSGIKAKILANELWYEIDDLQDLDIAQSLFTNTSEEKYKKLTSRYGGYWRYPNIHDYCYLVNPYFPPKRLIAEIKSEFGTLLSQYPSGQRINSLLAAKYFGLSQDMVVVGNGAAELIKSLGSFLKGSIGVVHPSFEEYESRLDPESIVHFTPIKPGYTYDSEDLIGYFEGTGISSLIIINPDNPSGQIMDSTNIDRLLKWTAEKGAKLIIDESFVDFSDGGTSSTLFDAEVLKRNPHLIVMKSISKSYGVPGLRLGVLSSGDTAMIEWMKSDVAIWNINSFGEFFLQIWEKYADDYQEALVKTREVRSRFYAQLRSCPFLRPFPSHSNYILCEVLTPHTASALAYRLLENDFLIKDVTGKKGITGEYVRIAIRTREENDRLIEILGRMGEFLEEDITL